MKPFLILFILVLSSRIANAQINTTLPATSAVATIRDWSWDGQHFTFWNADTLIIFEPSRFHFIKIGSLVYKITPHNTTIDKVEPEDNPGQIIIGGGSVNLPVWHNNAITVDTTVLWNTPSDHPYQILH